MSSSTTYQIPKLPLNIELESKEVLKQMDDTKTYMNTSFQDLKIAVAGTGYVGLSIATLLA